MKKVIAFLLLAIVCFSAFVVVLAPASAVWRYAAPHVQPKLPELEIASVQGTIWSGSADAYYRQFPASELSWNVSALTLLKTLLNPTISADVLINGEGHELTGNLAASQNSLIIPSLTGHIDSLYINRVSQPQGLTFAGKIDIDALSVKSDLVWVQDVDGLVSWPGGKIVSRTRAAGTRIFELPALDGVIDMQEQNIRLTIRPKSRNETLLEVVIQPDGWIVVRVKGRLFEVAGLPWPPGSGPDDTVLQFEEKLLRGIQ